jgi:predicted porin
LHDGAGQCQGVADTIVQSIQAVVSVVIAPVFPRSESQESFMHRAFFALAALCCVAGAAQAQGSSITLYGRVDLSFAQQADAPRNREIRNGSASRFGVRGVEDLGGGLKAVFDIEHRFNADEGTPVSTRFWEGKSIVGLEGRFGRITLGREENPAFTYAQVVADPFRMDTVASNLTILNGRVGSTRYSSSVNYRWLSEPYVVGVQVAEAEGNPVPGGQAERRPYSLGLAFEQGAWRLGVGYENPADADDRWATLAASYDLGALRIGAFIGSGENVAGQGVRAYLVSAVAPVAGGELRTSYGELKNRGLRPSMVLDKQFGLGYHYALSKRTIAYVDVVNERRDGIARGLRKTGYDLGLRHSF